MIEKLELISAMAAAFEKRKKKDPSLWNSIFLVAVAFIGWGIDTETDHAHAELIGELGAWAPEQAPDDSHLCERYLQICSNFKSGSYLHNG